MTVLQRTDLTTSQKIQCAAAAVAGQHAHGSKTALSETYEISRPTVYAVGAAAQSVLRSHFDRRCSIPRKISQFGYGAVVRPRTENLHQGADEIRLPELRPCRPRRDRGTAADAEKTSQPTERSRRQAVEEQCSNWPALEEREESRHRVLVLCGEAFHDFRFGLLRNNQLCAQPVCSLCHGHAFRSEFFVDDGFHQRGFQIADAPPEQSVQYVEQVPRRTHGKGVQQPWTYRPGCIPQPLAG